MRLCNISQKSEKLALSEAVVKRLKRPKRGREYLGGRRGGKALTAWTVREAVTRLAWRGKSCARIPRWVEEAGSQIPKGFECYAEQQV